MSIKYRYLNVAVGTVAGSTAARSADCLRREWVRLLRVMPARWSGSFGPRDVATLEGRLAAIQERSGTDAHEV